MFYSPARRTIVVGLLFVVAGCSLGGGDDTLEGESWLAGDHHIHSRFSVGWDRETDPPAPILGGDAIYSIPTNSMMARKFGLHWTVATDHGGPNHSKVNFEQAYPELLASRAEHPDLIQFFGMELNSPGADHSSIIIPYSDGEAEQLRSIESSFDKHEAWPSDPGRDQPERMLTALRTMAQQDPKPVVIVHHPSRSATGMGEYGLYDPAEIRDWNDTAPDIAVGMEGAPGHQAGELGTERKAPRGAYGRFPTMGGFDQMTARLGGFWDSMLGEGRHWWITANSDSHVHYTEGGIDFWPGEYSKTYVHAKRNHQSILEALRAGKIFVTTGDLVSSVDLDVTSGGQTAGIGGTLNVQAGTTITLNIRVRDPDADNHNGENPAVSRVDLIVGDVTGPLENRAADTNPSTHVSVRFTANDWVKEGEVISISREMTVTGPMYIRLRGTNTDQLEPDVDPRGEDPWQDLWFYSNPVFVMTND